MTAPNLNSSTLTVKAVTDEFITNTVSETVLTTNTTASGHTFITLSLTAANTTSSGLSVSVNWFQGNGSVNAYILKSALVPGNAQIECAPTRKMLLEGWQVKVTTPDSTSGITFTHHYLDCS